MSRPVSIPIIPDVKLTKYLVHLIKSVYDVNEILCNHTRNAVVKLKLSFSTLLILIIILKTSISFFKKASRV